MGVIRASIKQRQRITSALVALFIVFVIYLVLHLHFDLSSSRKKSKCLKIARNITHSKADLQKPKIRQYRPPNRDKFEDLVTLVEMDRHSISNMPFENVIIRDPEDDDPENPTLGKVAKMKPSENSTYLDIFHLESISKKSTYRESDPLIPLVLHDIATQPIVHSEIKSGGTQLKLKFTFANGNMAIFKPKRFSYDTTTRENHFYFTDFERYHSEIGAFHLDRALGFRRTMPTVGRKVSISRDILKYATDEFEKTVYISPANNTCFYSKCMYYCNIFHPVCGQGDELEGSLNAYLPTFRKGSVREYLSPWKRSYSPWRPPRWNGNDHYCDTARKQSPWNEPRPLLDLIDLNVFDFLMDNSDRHSFAIFKIFGKGSAPMIFDNGRGFGRPFGDFLEILTVFMQCCVIRSSTVQMLLKYNNGPVALSEVMRESLATDPLSPVIWEPYYEALDRRIPLILQQVRECVAKANANANATLSSHISVRSGSSTKN